MIDGIYAVYDAKAEAFGVLISVPTKAAAVRSFADAVKSGSGDLSKHPEDFALFQLGVWNKASGVIDAFKTPISVITGLECSQMES